MVANATNGDQSFQGEKDWRSRSQYQNQHRKKTANHMAEETIPTGPCNLDRFLESTRPSVPVQHPSKIAGKWSDCETETVPSFLLGDLWESFREWSVYGASVPIILNGSNNMVQYYVPYLSAIQLYAESHSPRSEFRQGADSDYEYSHDSSSDISSSDVEQERMMSNAQLMLDNISLRDNYYMPHQDSSFTDPPLFEFFENDSPYAREPLSDKICSLATQFPPLRILRNCDLSPGSWFSVAWYPIYRIPIGNTLRTIDACFLTYHYLSPPSKGAGSNLGPFVSYKNEREPVISIPTFGLANYKFRPIFWTPRRSEKQVSSSLQQCAYNWIRAMDVHHPDYQFFTSHSSARKSKET